MHRLVVILVLFTVMVSEGISQRVPEVDIDYASFAYSDQESMIEIYLAANPNSLTYMANDSNYTAVIPLHLKLLHPPDNALGMVANSPVWSQENNLQFTVEDTSGSVKGQAFLHQTRFIAAPGEYELQVVMPISGLDSIQATQSFFIPDFSQSDFCLISDITLASKIARSNDRTNSFYKNGLTILPNVTQLYGEGVSKLFYYAEAYNTRCVASDADEYTLLVYVSDANGGSMIPDLQKRTQRSVRQADVLIGSFDLVNLVSGTYFLRMAVLNRSNEVMVDQSRKFFVYNPSVEATLAAADVVEFEASEYATMPEEEVEKQLKYIRVIATDQESRRIRRVEGLIERRKLLSELWQVRDPTPRTAVNEFRDDFFGLLAYANESYSEQLIEGWETDRGNVLLRYGPPSAIEPLLYERELRPHEIWTYNNIPGEGKSEFIFADLSGFGEFELIHSTVMGERKREDWLNEISDTF